MEFTKTANSAHYKILDNYIMEIIEEEEYVKEQCNCEREDCEKCDPLWLPGIDTTDEESESDYDSDDSMDDVYEECGLTCAEKKMLHDELNALIEEAEESIQPGPEH